MPGSQIEEDGIVLEGDMDFESTATRYRADCPLCGSHAVMKVRRPLTLELEPRPIKNPWKCIVCGTEMELDYPEGISG